MTDGQLQRQIVGMTMPLACAQWVDHRERRSSPAQPRTFPNQLQRNIPLADTRGGQHPLSGVLTVTEPSPEGLRHQCPSRILKQ